MKEISAGEAAYMERTVSVRGTFDQSTWEEKSGLLGFLAKVYAEVARFDKTFAFGISQLHELPERIDGRTDLQMSIGFVVIRRTSALIGRDYCLYAVLRGRELAGYIGIYADGNIDTVRNLKPMTDFRNGSVILHDWLRDLVKASCEKI